jgi:hypothetical protein
MRRVFLPTFVAGVTVIASTVGIATLLISNNRPASALPIEGLLAVTAALAAMLAYKLGIGLRNALNTRYGSIPKGHLPFVNQDFWFVARIFARGGIEILKVVVGVFLFLVANAGLSGLGM